MWPVRGEAGEAGSEAVHYHSHQGVAIIISFKNALHGSLGMNGEGWRAAPRGCTGTGDTPNPTSSLP